MELATYLMFDGNGAEAAEYYAGLFGGEIVMSMKFGDMPEQPDWVTDATRARLAHASVRIGSQMLMLSDTAGAEPFPGHAGFSINIGFPTAGEAKAIFDRLAANGTVRMPFEKTFWAAGFGVVVDKFGISWMCNSDAE